MYYYTKAEIVNCKMLYSQKLRQLTQEVLKWQRISLYFFFLTSDIAVKK